ncbi:MAG: thiolase family protein [Betaproteobacteria bacterium]|nr:thiolase family protein [Betaproteobacteria bacterium]
MTDAVWVAGVGMTSFGRHPQTSLRALGRVAGLDALTDAASEPAEIGAVYCGSALSLLLQGEGAPGQAIGWELGIRGVPVFNVANACASGATALHLAWRDLAAGLHDCVLVIGVDKALMPKGSVLKVGAADPEVRLGEIFPATFALVAQQHMRRFGTTPAQMAEISVKNHRHGSLNPLAQFNQLLTRQEVLDSMMVADPLTLYSCCPNSDGAAALVLRRQRRGPRDLVLAASVLSSGQYDNPRDFTRWECEIAAAKAAYALAGTGPAGLDVVEVHDAFTICEIVHYEGLGLCAPGAGGALAERGATALGGRVPVNPSGGLLARGHPPGASGVAQVVEIATQLRGEAGARQVPNARVGLAQIMGGSQAGDTQACAVHILRTY